MSDDIAIFVLKEKRRVEKRSTELLQYDQIHPKPLWLRVNCFNLSYLCPVEAWLH